VARLNHQVRAERLKPLRLATDATFRDQASPQLCWRLFASLHRLRLWMS
jgi:hypothetical protein